MDLDTHEPLLLTIEAAATRLAIGRTRAYELVASGRLTSVKLGRSRRVRVLDLEDFVAGLPADGAPEEEPAHCVCGGTPRRREDVAVDVGRHADRGVTEHVGDDLKRHALGEHQARRAVPQLVRVPVTDPRGATDRLELPVEVPRIDRRAERRREDEGAAVPPLPYRRTRRPLALEVDAEDVDHRTREALHPSAP